MENAERQTTNVLLTLPVALNAKLMSEAEKSKRSRHSQILIALEKYFETPLRLGKQEKSK